MLKIKQSSEKEEIDIKDIDEAYYICCIDSYQEKLLYFKIEYINKYYTAMDTSCTFSTSYDTPTSILDVFKENMVYATLNQEEAIS